MTNGAADGQLIDIPESPHLCHVRAELSGLGRRHAEPAPRATPPCTAEGGFIEVQPCRPISAYVVHMLAHAANMERIEFVPGETVKATDNWKIEPYPAATWAKLGITGSIIRSFTNGIEELIHVRTFSPFRRIALGEAGYSGAHGAEVRGVKRPCIDDGAGAMPEGGKQVVSVRVRDIGELDWEDATDYKGLVVPLEVLGMMRKVDGKTLEEWQGRGVEVGEDGWKVLTDWAARQPG